LGLVGEAGWYGELDRLAGISVLVPNSPTLYTLSGIPAHPYLLWRCPGLGTRAQTMPMRAPNCWSRPSHPVLSGTPPSPFALIDFPAPTASAIPPEATAQRSAGAYCQTTVSSDGSPPTAANNSGHVSPAVPPVFTSRCCKLVSDQFSIRWGKAGHRPRSGSCACPGTPSRRIRASKRPQSPCRPPGLKPASQK